MKERWQYFFGDTPDYLSDLAKMANAGSAGVIIDESHIVSWDIEGWGQECEKYMQLIASIPNMLVACAITVELFHAVDAHGQSLGLKENTVQWLPDDIEAIVHMVMDLLGRRTPPVVVDEINRYRESIRSGEFDEILELTKF